MILIEFDINWNYGLNIIKYRNIENDQWYYLYIDIETLNLLIMNYGIISAIKIPTRFTSSDRPTTGEIIKIKYCNSDIEIICKNKINLYTRYSYLNYIEQNY